MTLEPFARRLGLTTEARPFYSPPVEIGAIQALGGDIMEYEVRAGDALAGTFIRDLDIPRAATVMLMVRGESGIPPRGSTLAAEGDRLYILVRGEARRAVENSMRRWQGIVPEEV